jgi:hypothetical protein
MRVVRFINSWCNYFIGDVAGFEPATALFLIDKGIAVEHEPIIKAVETLDIVESKPKRKKKNETEDSNS